MVNRQPSSTRTRLDGTKKKIPNEARGNPVYEQTRQDMPFWCCGINCGRNSRIAVLLLSIIGIICSIIVIQSPNYFQYESLRNDTFFDVDKLQPPPFQWATKANVGLFKYELLELYEPLETSESPTFTPIGDPPTPIPIPINIIVDENVTDTPSMSPTSEIDNGLPYNPNLHPINVVLEYDFGRKQFEEDGAFTKAQTCAIIAPIMAVIGIIFGLIELICCLYICSWLPTALFLYLAFMMQLITLFLFLSDNFCNYAQDCKLGPAGAMSAIAVVCYLIANTLVCCTPRPRYSLLRLDMCKKPPQRKKKNPTKKKKQPDDDDEERGGSGNNDSYSNTNYNEDSHSGKEDQTYRTPSTRKAGNRENQRRQPASPKKNKNKVGGAGGGGGNNNHAATTKTKANTSKKNLTKSPNNGKKRRVGQPPSQQARR